MKNTVGAFFLFFLMTGDLFALPAQKIIPPDSCVYEALSVISREQAKIFFNDSSLTVAQVQAILGSLDPEKFSDEGLRLFDELSSFLDSPYSLGLKSGAFGIGIDWALRGEGYYKTNQETAWIHDYHHRDPFARAAFSISLDPWFNAEIEPYVGTNEYAATLHESYINLPLDPVSQFDIHFPKWANFSAGVPVDKVSGFNFAIGIGNDFWGRTRTGSIVLSEYPERTSYAQLTLYSPYVKYGAEVMQHQVNKYQYMHYLHFRFFSIITLSFTEGVMVNAPLELRFLNPLSVFHGFESYKTYDDYNEDIGNTEVEEPTGGSRIGSYLGVKLEAQPWKYMRFYGLFAMNQLQLGIEKDNWNEDLTPDALAFQGGAEFSLPFHRGFWIFGLEGIYTYPFMYVLHDKNWSFYKQLDEVDNMDVRYWIGTPFGPDSIAGTLWLGYHRLNIWSLEFSFVCAAQGERSGTDIFDRKAEDYRPSHDYYDMVVPPTGTPINTYTFSLRGTWTPLPWLRIGFEPGYRIVTNAGHVSGKTEQGFEFVLMVSVRPKFGTLTGARSR
jgi:hypothetical protein